MENNKKERNVLDELNKGAYMGMDAIHYILDKVKDESLKEEWNRQYREYKEIAQAIEKLYPKYNDEKSEPHKTNTINKIMTWYGIEMKTILDSSTSKIAELLLQGTNMGIIEGRKLLNNKQTKENINNLVKKYVSMQETAVEKLKKFL